MTKLKIGVSQKAFSLPLREALVQISRVGAGGVQIIPYGELAPENLSETGTRALRRLLESLDLKVASVAFPTRRGYNVAAQLEERIAATKRALALSYQLRAPVVTNSIGPWSEDPDDAGRILQSQALQEIGQFAEHVGAVFAITPDTHSPTQLKGLLETLASAGLGVNYDPATVILAGLDPVRGVRELGTWVRHTDARDAAAGASSESAQAIPLGRGSLDWAEYLAALEEFNYRGWFVIQRSGGDDPHGDTERAVKFLASF
jgi:sugar phosphate isomerase/epimerase